MCVVLALSVLPCLLTFLSDLLYSECLFWRAIYDSMNYDDIKTTLISIAFTSLGFAITLRNILIGREHEKFFGFSVKAIIRYSTKTYSKICWYIIMIVPFMEIYLFVRGYRRQLIIYTLLSAVFMIIYFVTVLQRIRKDVNIETISYQFIDNILNPDDVYAEEYRKELFEKLFCESSTFPEVKQVFDGVLKNLYQIVFDPCFLGTNFIKTIKMTELQKSIRRKMPKKSLDSPEVKKAIQTISLYTYEYYDHLFCFDSSIGIKSMTEQLKLFVDNTGINVSVLAKSTIYQDCMGFEHTNKDEAGLNSNAYLLLSNYLLGMLCAGINHLSLAEYQKLTEEIARICVQKTVLLSGAEIYALSLLVMYYRELVKGFAEHANNKTPHTDTFDLYYQKLFKRYERQMDSKIFESDPLNLYYQDLVKGFEGHQNSKISYAGAFVYGRTLAKLTEENDYKLLERFLHKDFSIDDSSFTFSDALSAHRNEMEKGNDIFFNILDNGQNKGYVPLETIESEAL